MVVACSIAPPHQLPSTGSGSTTSAREPLGLFPWTAVISGCRAATCLLVLRMAARCSLLPAPPPSPMRWDAHSAAGEGTESGFPVAPPAVSKDATFEALAAAVARSLRMPAPPFSCPATRSATASGECASGAMWTLPGPWARATSSSTAPRGMCGIGASPFRFFPRDLPPRLRGMFQLPQLQLPIVLGSGMRGLKDPAGSLAGSGQGGKYSSAEGGGGGAGHRQRGVGGGGGTQVPPPRQQPAAEPCQTVAAGPASISIPLSLLPRPSSRVPLHTEGSLTHSCPAAAGRGPRDRVAFCVQYRALTMQVRRNRAHARTAECHAFPAELGWPGPLQISSKWPGHFGFV